MGYVGKITFIVLLLTVSMLRSGNPSLGRRFHKVDVCLDYEGKEDGSTQYVRQCGS